MKEARTNRQSKRPGRGTAPARSYRRLLIGTAIAGVAALATVLGVLRTAPADIQKEVFPERSAKTAATTGAGGTDVALSDDELQRRADRLLAAVNPDLPENEYFSDYMRDKLRWMMRQHAARRLTVAFLEDPERIQLPSDVLMAASQLDGAPTIFIVKPRFAAFLRERATRLDSVDPQQKNDFAVALVHELVHLQNPAANPRNPDVLFREEARVWREVTLQVVRPLHARNQPMSRRLLEVDAALRLCADELPCPALARLVRLTR